MIGMYIFFIERGCESILFSASSDSGVENFEFIKYVLLLVDDFVCVLCDKFYDVWELIFCKYDINLIDGVFDYDEFDRAICE